VHPRERCIRHRGAAPESVADGVHYPGTYAAGFYNRLRDEVGGRVVENESLVNLPNWLELRFAFDDGEWVDLGRMRICIQAEPGPGGPITVGRGNRWRALRPGHTVRFVAGHTAQHWADRVPVAPGEH
jgi:Glycosyl hydrolase family 65, N-terminal domain